MFESTYYPLIADVYYATQTQNDFGEIDKTWDYNKFVRLQLSMTTNYKDQQVQAEQFFFVQDVLNGKCATDLRVNDAGQTYSMTDILITNIRNDSGTVIYTETVGVLEGKPTIYEVSGVLPHVDPWGRIDYYKIVIERSDVQELSD